MQNLHSSRRMLLTTRHTEDDLSEAVADIMDLTADALASALMYRCVDSVLIFRDGGWGGHRKLGDIQSLCSMRGAGATLDIILNYSVDEVWGWPGDVRGVVPHGEYWAKDASSALSRRFGMTEKQMRSLLASVPELIRPLSGVPESLHAANRNLSSLNPRGGPERPSR